MHVHVPQTRYQETTGTIDAFSAIDQYVGLPHRGDQAIFNQDVHPGLNRAARCIDHVDVAEQDDVACRSCGTDGSRGTDK